MEKSLLHKFDCNFGLFSVFSRCPFDVCDGKMSFSWSVIFSDLGKTFRSRYSEKTCIHPAWKSARVPRGKGRSPDLDVKRLQRSVDPGRTLPLVKVRTSPFNWATRFRRIETLLPFAWLHPLPCWWSATQEDIAAVTTDSHKAATLQSFRTM